MDNSKIVTTNQQGIHQNLEKVLSKYSVENYQRPVAPFSSESFKKIKDWLKNEEFILDLGCGVGESSYHLAVKYPSLKILGIDKSLSRIERNNAFKKNASNVLLVRGEILDLVPLIYRELNEQLVKTYLLFPNPWPKSTHYKKRFHFNPIMPFLAKLRGGIHLRSNWRLYLEEFNTAYEYFNQLNSQITTYEPEEYYMTPFEKKYHLSGQRIYELIIN